MKRLVMIAVFIGLIASAQWGLEPTSRAVAKPAAETRHSVSTSVDAARASVPLPRLAQMAPPPVNPEDEARRQQTDLRASRTSRSADSAERVWAALARCESDANPRARSADGRYYGAFQFSPATWQSLGYSGLPTSHSYVTQLRAAQKLQARSGWGQWPRCSRQLGLR